MSVHPTWRQQPPRRGRGRPFGSGLFRSPSHFSAYVSDAMRGVLRDAYFSDADHVADEQPAGRKRLLRQKPVAAWIAAHADALDPPWPDCTGARLRDKARRLRVGYCAIRDRVLADLACNPVVSEQDETARALAVQREIAERLAAHRAEVIPPCADCGQALDWPCWHCPDCGTHVAEGSDECGVCWRRDHPA